MSKRRGDVVFLDEFMDEIGVDAARWYLVNRSPDQAIEIDVDLAAERSEKNPVYYVQYAHARIAGVLRNAGGAAASAEPAARSRPKSVTSSSGCWSSPRSRPRRSSGAGLTGSRRTRSASPTSSTASITTTASSRARRSRSAWDCAGRRGPVIASCLDLVGVEAPERM